MKKVDGKRLAVIVSAVKAYSDSISPVEQEHARSPGISLAGTSANVAGNGYHVPLTKAPLNIWGIAGRQDIMLQRNMVKLDAHSRN